MKARVLCLSRLTLSKSYMKFRRMEISYILRGNTKALCAHACSVQALQMAFRDPLRRKMTAELVMKSIFSLKHRSAILLQPVVFGSYCRIQAPFKERWLRRRSKTVRYVYSIFNFDSIEPHFISSNAFSRKILAQKGSLCPEIE